MTAVEQPSGSVTLVFTDIEGSTKLLEELGVDAYKEALAEHRRVVREACGRYSGYEVDYEGDAFFYAFVTARDAVLAVSEAMQGLAEGPIRIRVGIHTGEPALDPPKYVGMDVHRAARIMAAAHGGQVLVSASTAALTGIDGLRDLGEHRFKDLTAPERVYQLGPGEYPALRTLHQTNLPIPQTPFLGREQELATVVELLARDDVRLLTLTGPGGTGKTRLALQAAGALAEHYPHGVFWVSLAPLRDPALVLESAAQTLGAQDGLGTHIGDKRLLLLFDNFEHLTEAAPDLSPLLSECPHLEILTTSRGPLRLAGEQEYPVPPLAREEAVDFFLSRARAVRPDFDTDEAIPEICRRLDELPLALELAAARTRALSPAQLLERLSQRLDLLKGGRDTDPRQQTLRATIEWSHDLLSEDEQRLFAWLAVFAGGCTLEAAEEVCDADIDNLESLVEKSLLRFTNQRYWMLETIKEYAAERLEVSDELVELQLRHTDYYLGFAERTTPRLVGGSDASRILQLLDADHDNFRQALVVLREAPATGGMLRLAASLGRYWYMRGYIVEGRAWLEQALAPTAGSTGVDAKAMLGLSILLDTAGEYAEAERVGESSVRLYRELGGSPDDLADALNHFGNVLANLGHFRRAQAIHDEALALSKELNNAYRVSRSLGNLSGLALELHEYERAADVAQEALRYARESADSLLQCVALGNWGNACAALGRVSEAAPLEREALLLSSELGMDELNACGLTAAAALTADDDPLRAATLLGCVDSLCEASEIALPIYEAALFHATAAELQERLGSGWPQAKEEGRRIESHEGVELALSALERIGESE